MIGVAWLSLDEGDNDLARFLTYLVLAVRTTSSQVGEQVLAGLRSAQPVPTDEALTTVLNEVAELPHDIVLVLDDFHNLGATPQFLTTTMSPSLVELTTQV
jgi:LuxR family maltose regulon positive regulatory protein